MSLASPLASPPSSPFSSSALLPLSAPSPARSRSLALALGGQGRTALHDAAMANTIDVAGALISAGAKVNAKDKKKATPLDMVRPHTLAAQSDEQRAR